MPELTLCLIFWDVLSWGFVGRLSLWAASGKKWVFSGRGAWLCVKIPDSTDLGPHGEPECLQHSAYHVATDDLRLLHDENLASSHSKQDKDDQLCRNCLESAKILTYLPGFNSTAKTDISFCVYIYFNVSKAARLVSVSRQCTVHWSTVVVPLKCTTLKC